MSSFVIETDCVFCDVQTEAEEITQHEALFTIETQCVVCELWLKKQ
jgi:hypothetical protein